MSFLKPAAGADSAATGLGQMFGTDGAHISSIADRIGMGANQIASAGGAQPAYAAPQIPQGISNHLQMLDPDMLQAILQHFRPGPMGVQHQ